jgi:SPX domain protein involved in polyphosphate accumulation
MARICDHKALPLAAPLQTHFERREFKYLLDEALVARVRAMIRPFCELDPFALAHPDHRYGIESLYFDTPSMDLYLANEREITDRYKLRVRTYPDAERSPAFFEVKRRYNDVIVKDRGRAPEDWVQAVSDPGWSPGDSDQGAVSLTTEAFVARVRARGCRPVCTVDYRREAWSSTIDDYARVTFDTQIRCQPVDKPGFGKRPGSWRSVDHAHPNHDVTRSPTVLELKFTRAVPSWMVNTVRTLELSRASFSKYGRSVEALALMPSLRAVAGGAR